MDSKSKICLFSIGNAFKEAGGPRTRITSIAKAIQVQDPNNTIILGSRLHKLKKAISAPKSKILYIETNTSCFKIVDFICLLILVAKCKKVVIYIRDVYYELIHKRENTYRGVKNIVLHKSSNFFYTLVANEMAFPTFEMGDLYFNSNKYYFKRPYFAFPPGTILPKNINEISSNTKTIKFLYLGSTRYQNSGFDTFIDLAKSLNESFEFHILTPDDISETLFSNFENDNGNIRVLSLSHSEVLEYIRENQITFAIHSRPRNRYDDITFPIKFMDFISCLLPVITFPHKPIVSLLGKNYPLYIDELTKDSLLMCIKKIEEDNNLYKEIQKNFLTLRNEKLYINQINKLMERVYS